MAIKGGAIDLIRGLYASASGLIAANIRQDVTANNLANASTVGFKKDSLLTESFANLLMRRLERGRRNNIGTLGVGLRAAEQYTDLEQGPMEYTGRPLDFAIVGRGFFVIATPDGERYTRDGSFQIDSEGYLATAGGDRVLGREGEAIHAEDVMGQDFLIVDFPRQGLQKEGYNKWRAAPNQQEDVLTIEGVVHGEHLEQSNVSIIKEMTEMIRVVRLYEAGQKMIQAQDETLGKAVNEIGRV